MAYKLLRAMIITHLKQLPVLLASRERQLVLWSSVAAFPVSVIDFDESM